MTPQTVNKLRNEAAIGAMNAIVSNPAAWAELQCVAEHEKMPVSAALAQAACNFADDLVSELKARAGKRVA